MVYIVENNGLRADQGAIFRYRGQASKKKKGPENTVQPIDLCGLAINLGCTFVARSYFWIEEAVDCSVEGRHEPRGIRAHRRHQPLCDLQQQRGILPLLFVRRSMSPRPYRGLHSTFRALEEVEYPSLDRSRTSH